MVQLPRAGAGRGCLLWVMPAALPCPAAARPLGSATVWSESF